MAIIIASIPHALLQCNLLLSHQKVESNASPLASVKAWVICWNRRKQWKKYSGTSKVRSLRALQLFPGTFGILTLGSVHSLSAHSTPEYSHHAVRVTNYKERPHVATQVSTFNWAHSQQLLAIASPRGEPCWTLSPVELSDESAPANIRLQLHERHPEGTARLSTADPQNHK